MIVLRITRGIAAHFPTRFPEWLMAWPAFLAGASFILQPGMFATSPSFSTIERWATQPAWACVVLVYAAIRLLALIVNGTFAGFRYSPHFRAAASLAGLWFWGQLCVGFTISALTGGGAWLAPVLLSTFVIAELVNLYRSASDIGPASKR